MEGEQSDDPFRDVRHRKHSEPHLANVSVILDAIEEVVAEQNKGAKSKPTTVAYFATIMSFIEQRTV
jgi:hypothetical protein